MYKNVVIIHRLLPLSTVQSTEGVKIFLQKFFALKVGLGREELQGIYEKSQEIKIKDLTQTDTVPYFCPPQLTYK